MHRITVSLPQEREYEGWLAREIEDYFLALGQTVYVFVISQHREKDDPADIWFEFQNKGAEGKLIGLQLKRPYLLNHKRPPFEQLYWEFDDPPGQLEKVKASDEIFYCLPTFLNRAYRRISLHHCIFWRPDESDRPTSGWYDERPKNASMKIKKRNKTKLGSEERWGRFVEGITRCTHGGEWRNAEVLRARIRELVAAWHDKSMTSDEALLMFAVQKPSTRAKRK
ncbi:MAG: hypothetical protein ACREHD_30470 [Pirellulales bacterium]